MKLLLDTHVFLWWIDDDKRLSLPARKAITSSANAAFLSVASAWELAVKIRLGKLKLKDNMETFIPDQLQRNAIIILPINLSHAMRLHHLPLHHRDPFDRMLVVQAQIEGMTLVTADPFVRLYDVPTLW